MIALETGALCHPFGVYGWMCLIFYNHFTPLGFLSGFVGLIA
jgi:hypothetical protein